MTLQELYETVGGDYTQATRVLRMDKLIDKHIRRLPGNGVVDKLIEAGKTMNAAAIFEAAHAMKGVCSNLGLTTLAAEATLLSDEFRPGTPRALTDAEALEKINGVEALYSRTKIAIEEYIASQG